MIVTAWNNGAHHESGAGYGIKIDMPDRDRFFDPSWPSIQLHLEGRKDGITINTAKPGFWNKTCRELISKDIGKWLIDQGLVPWPKGKPPKLVLEPLGNNHFRLRRE